MPKAVTSKSIHFPYFALTSVLHRLKPIYNSVTAISITKLNQCCYVFCIMLSCVWLSCSVAVITFTHLELNNSLVDVSNSYYSISEFSPITLPENPGNYWETFCQYIKHFIAPAFSQ